MNNYITINQRWPSATLRLRVDELDKFRRLAGLTTNTTLAARMDYDAGNLGRVLAGQMAFGTKFIASLVAAFGGAVTLDDLFEVVEPTRDDVMTCPRCDGQGQVFDCEAGRDCPLCKGKGTVSAEVFAEWADSTLRATSAKWGATGILPVVES